MRTWRILLVSAGSLLGLFGIFRLLTEIPSASLVLLAGWLIAAVAIHDGVWSPAVLGLGVVLRRGLPDRARRHVQFGLIAAGAPIVIALPMIYLQGSQPVPKALLLRDYAGNTITILVVVAGAVLVGYLIAVVRDRADDGP